MTYTRILHGHCLDVLATLPDNSVHCVVTSPPYYGLRDYKTPEVSFPAGTFTPVAGLPSMVLPAWTGHLGLEPDPWQCVGHATVLVVHRWRGRDFAPDSRELPAQAGECDASTRACNHAEER